MFEPSTVKLPPVSDELVKRRRDALRHIVHDHANLVAAGTLVVNGGAAFPMNHFAQHAFLVECRKFANFYTNNRGPKKKDMVVREFACKKLRVQLGTWKDWHVHMNTHLMHLSYGRVDNKRPWDPAKDGTNGRLLAEFQRMWQEFTKVLDPRLKTAFEAQMLKRLH